MSIKELFRGAAGRAMIVGVSLMLFQQFSGVNAVFFYASQVLCQHLFIAANHFRFSKMPASIALILLRCLLPPCRSLSP